MHYNIPERTKQTIDDYVTKGWEPGDFVYAVLTNNLSRSIAYADMQNMHCLKDIVAYVYCEIPHVLWGCQELVEAHLASFRKPKDDEK